MMNKDDRINGDYVRIENLNIDYKIHSYPIHSLKDQFIFLLKNPKSLFKSDSQNYHALKDFHLSLKKGDRLGVLGINGSGKTSLCRYIAGMQGPLHNIKIYGTVRAIFETDSCFMPELTGRENGLILAKLLFPEIKREQRKALVDEAISFSEIGKFGDTPFKYFSKGMKTRLFLSLVSSMPSDVLILDEVFDGADHFFNKKITERILNLIYLSGVVIFVSHSLEHIRTTCNRVIVLSAGQKVFDGEVEEGIDYYLKNCAPYRGLVRN